MGEDMTKTTATPPPCAAPGDGLDSLIGCDVEVSWRDESAEWRWYRVVMVDRLAGWIRLLGLPSPDGDPFVGAQFWASLSDVLDIEIVDTLPNVPVRNRGRQR